jgi:hypothetical protein
MNMPPFYAELRRFAYKTLVVIGALTLCVGLATAATTIGTNIVTDGTLNVGSLFGIATSSPGSLFSVGGVTNFTTATSTFYSNGGINLAGGCFAVNGTCVGGGSGGTTPSPLPFFGTQTSNPWVRPGLAQFNSWLNQGDATATDGANGLPILLRSDVNASQQNKDDGNIVGVFKASPSPPYTIVASLGASGNIIGTGTSDAPASEVYQFWFPIVLFNSTSHAAIAFGWGPPATVGGGGAVNIWTYSNTAPGHTPGYFLTQGFGFPFGSYFGWFKLVNDGTNITLYISDEGQDWQEVFTDTLADLGSGTGGVTTFDKVGFGFDTAPTAFIANAGSMPLTMAFQSAKLWSWIETSP